MSINVYESGNPVQSSNNTSNLLFADQFVDRTQISSCGMNGTDSDFHENQNISFNFPVSQVTQQAQIPQNIAYFNRIPDINEGNGDSINIIGENNIIRQNTNGFNYDPFIINSQMTYNQPYTRFNIAQNNFNDDTNNMTLGGNIILAFPSQQNDNINTMQNIIALPTNNGNSFDYLGSMISNTAWISNASQTVQTIDPRHMYNGRQIERSRHNQTTSNGDSRFGKPVFSYSCLIALALRHSELGSLPVNEIYKYMQDNFPYFKNAPDGWKNSVRHNLSLNKAFQKTVRNDTTSTQRKGCLWTLKPEKKRIIEKEIRKWFKKHPEAIRRSMSNPENFMTYFTTTEESGDESPRVETREGSNPGSSNNIEPEGYRISENDNLAFENLIVSNTVSFNFPTNNINGRINSMLGTNINENIQDSRTSNSWNSNDATNGTLVEREMAERIRNLQYDYSPNNNNDSNGFGNM